MNPELATFGTRFVAWIIDVLVLMVPAALVHLGFPIGGPLLLGFFYVPILHASPIQATLGKKALGIRVTDTKGGTLTLQMAFLRYLVQLASCCMLFAGHFVALFTSRRQALHDLVADSIVVEGKIEGIGVFDAWVRTLRRLFGVDDNAGPPKPIYRPEPDAPKTSPDEVRRRLDELERLHGLKEKGVISEEEYQKLRRDLV